MSRYAVALVAGILFGAGLAVSGMMNPGKVISFLNFIDNWDPSLAFVMASAVSVFAVGNRLIRRRKHPFCDLAFLSPADTKVDFKLVIGGVIFGVGWGLSGLCPGPAIAVLVTGQTNLGIFFLALIGGMLVHRTIIRFTG